MRTRTEIEASRLNLAAKILLDGEDEVAFRDLVADLYDEFQPATAFEESLVRMMAVARWRQERVWNMERNCIHNPAALDRILSYESRYERQYLRAHQRLIECIKARRGSVPPPARPHTGSNVIPINRAA
jgi:hypothetical protein